MFLRDSLKMKFVMLRTGPEPKVGMHLVPDRYFPSLTLCVVSQNSGIPGFGSGSPWPGATTVFHPRCTCQVSPRALQQPHCANGTPIQLHSLYITLAKRDERTSLDKIQKQPWVWMSHLKWTEPSFLFQRHLATLFSKNRANHKSLFCLVLE